MTFSDRQYRFFLGAFVGADKISKLIFLLEALLKPIERFFYRVSLVPHIRIQYLTRYMMFKGFR